MCPPVLAGKQDLIPGHPGSGFARNILESIMRIRRLEGMRAAHLHLSARSALAPTHQCRPFPSNHLDRKPPLCRSCQRSNVFSWPVFSSEYAPISFRIIAAGREKASAFVSAEARARAVKFVLEQRRIGPLSQYDGGSLRAEVLVRSHRNTLSVFRHSGRQCLLPRIGTADIDKTAVRRDG